MRRIRQRGFSLIELMVGMVVTLIVFGGVTATFIAVQAAYHREAKSKTVIETSRGATSYVSRLVRYAGYGLLPEWSLDFSFPADNLAVAGTNAVTDDFAFRFRDPYFMRRGTYDSGTGTVQLVATATDPEDTFKVALPRGQRLLVSCAGGTVGALVQLSAAVTAADDQVNVTAVPNTPSTAFSFNTPNACLTDGLTPPNVFVVHEKRLRVIEQGGRPWLVVFHDHLNPAGNPNFDPIAVDVENFQVAYVMNSPHPTSPFGGATLTGGGGNWILGDDVGDARPDPTVTPVPNYAERYDGAARYNAHPANVRSVRLSFTSRTRSADAVRSFVSEPATIENYTPAAATPDGFYRFTTTTAVRLSNQTSRASFTSLQGATVDFNFNGG